MNAALPSGVAASVAGAQNGELGAPPWPPVPALPASLPPAPALPAALVVPVLLVAAGPLVPVALPGRLHAAAGARPSARPSGSARERSVAIGPGYTTASRSKQDEREPDREQQPRGDGEREQAPAPRRRWGRGDARGAVAGNEGPERGGERGDGRVTTRGILCRQRITTPLSASGRPARSVDGGAGVPFITWASISEARSLLKGSCPVLSW